MLPFLCFEINVATTFYEDVLMLSHRYSIRFSKSMRMVLEKQMSASWSATKLLYASRICPGVARLASSSVILNLEYL